MFILICVVITIIEVMILKVLNKTFERKVYIGIFFCNLIMSIAVYVYAIGYSLNVFKAITYRITPNLVYFSCIVFVSAVCSAITCYFYKPCSRNKIKIFAENDKKDKLVLTMAIVVAAVLRITGFWWGNGVTFHPDEGNVVRSPISMSENNTLMSENTFYPAQTSAKIMSIIFKIYRIICSAINVEYSTVNFYYLGRIYIAILSTAIVICVFFIGNRLKKHAGTLACVLTALFPPFVHMAHCITGDTVIAFFGCLAMLLSLCYLNNNTSYRWLVGMSVTAAAAAMEKWNGAVICGLIAVVVIVKNCDRKKIYFDKIIKQGIFSIICVLVSIVIIAPNLVSRLPEVIENILYIQNGYEGSNSFLDNFYQYMMEFVSYAGIICLPLLIVGIYCVLKLVYQGGGKDICCLSVGLFSLIGMCIQNRALTRWGYMFYVCFIILIGIGMMYIIESHLQHKRIVRMGIGFITVLVLLNMLAGSFWLDVIYTHSDKDTRIVSEKWCLDNNIRVEECIYDNYTCWEPGGVTRHPVEWDKTGVSRNILDNENDIVIKCIGKKYAVDNPDRFPDSNGITKNLPIVAVFESAYNEDGFIFEFYHSYSNKIYTLKSIYDSISKSIDVLKNNVYIGDTINIYDISGFPSSEIFEIDRFEKTDLEDGMTQYSENISSITQGKYTIEFTDAKFSDGKVYFEDASGNMLTSVSLTDKSSYTVEFEKQYYNVICRIAADEADCFSSVTIKSQL